jgi:hypothetical protein
LQDDNEISYVDIKDILMPFKSVALGIAQPAALSVACIQLDSACNHRQTQVGIR